MNKIKNILIKPLEKTKYVKPYTMSYTQNGIPKTWDLLTVHDSVAILIYNITRNVLVFVKQFRPAVYFSTILSEDRRMNLEIDTQKYPPENGITVELCAGILDKNISIYGIAKEEIYEECGYNVCPSSFELIGSCKAGVGSFAAQITELYCEVTDNMKEHDGGGIDGEFIEVIEMTLDEVRSYVKQTSVIKSPPSFMYGVFWFLLNKVSKKS